MSDKKNLRLLDFTIGFYEQALKLLEPGSDDFSILSGCILLMVGLEKLIKWVLYTNNPLLILLDKIDYKDLIAADKGESFDNKKTISFEFALERLVYLFPSIAKEKHDIEEIIKNRNLLMHNFGYIDIGTLENKVQTKVADISELICKECLGKSPNEIFGQKIWDKMAANREAYRKADILEIEQMIRHLKRLYSQGQSLPCKHIDIPEDLEIQSISCPVCEANTAEVALDWDIDVDHREKIVLGALPYLSLIKCNCGFSMDDPDKIEILMSHEYNEILNEMMEN